MNSLQDSALMSVGIKKSCKSGPALILRGGLYFQLRILGGGIFPTQNINHHIYSELMPKGQILHTAKTEHNSILLTSASCGVSQLKVAFCEQIKVKLLVQHIFEILIKKKKTNKLYINFQVQLYSLCCCLLTYQRQI